MPIPRKKMKMSSIIYSFYTYLGLKTVYEDMTKESFELSHRVFNKKFEDFNPSIEKWIENLALSLKDYLSIISWGEARHSFYNSDYYIPEIYGIDSRDKSYIMGSYYNPEQFLPILENLFYEEWIGESFGGENWARIAGAALLFRDMPPTVFVDHIMDIVHNGSTCFDKKTMIHLDYNPLEILDHKREKFIWEPSLCHSSYQKIGIHPLVYELFKLATNHSLLRYREEFTYPIFFSEDIAPPRIKWGILNISSIKNKDEGSPSRCGHKLYRLQDYKEVIVQIKKETKLIKEKQKEKKKQLYLFSRQNRRK